jgi:hypothetical protein
MGYAQTLRYEALNSSNLRRLVEEEDTRPTWLGSACP